MQAFIERDLLALKTKLLGIIYSVNIGKDGDLIYGVNERIITKEQKSNIATYISLNYPISLEPLPLELHPLIDIAKAEIVDARQTNWYTAATLPPVTTRGKYVFNANGEIVGINYYH